MSKQADPVRHNPLPRYVGYREVCDALGCSRSTMERMVRDGRFPKPVQLSPNRVGWDVSVIEAELATRAKGLAARAVTDPEELAPQELEDEARRLAAAAHHRRTGKTVQPEDFLLNPVVEEEQFVLAQQQAEDVLVQYLAELKIEQAAVAAMLLLPQLRPALRGLVSVEALPCFDGPLTLEYTHLVRQALWLFRVKMGLAERGLVVPPGIDIFDHVAKFPLERAAIVALGLFPPLMALIQPLCIKQRDGRSGPLFNSEDEFNELFGAAINDEAWTSFRAKCGWQDEFFFRQV